VVAAHQLPGKSGTLVASDRLGEVGEQLRPGGDPGASQLTSAKAASRSRSSQGSPQRVISTPSGNGSATSLIASQPPLGATAVMRDTACARNTGNRSSAAREPKYGCRIRRKRERSGGS